MGGGHTGSSAAVREEGPEVAELSRADGTEQPLEQGSYGAMCIGSDVLEKTQKCQRAGREGLDEESKLHHLIYDLGF